MPRLTYGDIQSTAQMQIPTLVRETNDRLRIVKQSYNQSEARENWVTEFGALGNGVADDTAAFDSAISAGGFVYVPSGTYLLDQVDVATQVHIRMAPDAILRQRSTGDEDIALFRFTTGSDYSTVYGGQFDGDASTHASSYTGSTETNKRVWTAIRTHGDVGYLRFENITIYDFLMAGFWDQNANHTTWDGIYIQSCGKGFISQTNDGGRLSNIVCEDIQNRSKAIFQHAIEIRDATGMTIDGIVVTDFQPDNSGIEPTPLAMAFERMTNLHARGLVANGFSGTGKAGMGFVFDSLHDSTVTDFSVTGGYEQGFSAQTCWDSTIDDFVIDLEYAQALGSSQMGVRIRPGGLFPALGAGATSENARANDGCRNLRISNGEALRAADWGFLIQSSDVELVGCSAIGCESHGFAVNENLSPPGLFTGASAAPVHSVEFVGCVAQHNGGAGLYIEDGANIEVNGGQYTNNGTDTTGGTNRAGIVVGANVDGLRLINPDVGDTNDWSTKTDGASFEPGSTVNDQYDVSLIDPSRVNVGQYIILRNADGSGDVTVRVIEKSRDDIIVETTGAVTFASTGNTAALTGTFDTDGSDLQGSSASLDTEVVGRTYVTDGSDWRLIVRVDDADNGVVESFPSDLSGATLTKLAVDVDPSTTNRQQYGVRIESGAANVLTRGVTGSPASSLWSIASGAETAFVPPSEGPMVSVASATTVALPGVHVVQITGTTTIDNFSGLRSGDEITLLFAGSVTIRDTTVSGGNILLSGGGNLNAGANDTLGLLYTGTNYVRLGGSNN